MVLIYTAALGAWRRVALRYEYLPFVYSDHIDVGCQAVGEIDLRFDVIEQWRVRDVEGTVT